MSLDRCTIECDYIKVALKLFKDGALNANHLNGVTVWIGASKNDKTSIETKNLYTCIFTKLGITILDCSFDAILNGRQKCDAILMFTITPGTSARAIEMVITSKYEKKYKLTDKLYVYMPKEYKEGYISRTLSNTLIAGKIFYKEKIQFRELNSNIFKKCIIHLMTIASDRRREMELTFKPTVLIVTALAKEFKMVEKLLDYKDYDYTNLGENANQYPHSRINKKEVVLAMTGMGNNFSAAIVTKVLLTYPSIKYIIMSGIAGGVPYIEKPKEHVRIGDIVLSNRQGIIQHDNGKETNNGFVYNFSPRPPDATILRNAEILVELTGKDKYKYWTNLDKLISLDPVLYSRPKKADLSDTPWLENTTTEQPILANGYDENRPRIHFGPIASGNQVIKNSINRDKLKKDFLIKAIEMEGSGLADASWLEGKDCFVVRGICDYSNPDKNNEWQEYAAAAAAAFTYELVEQLN